MRCVSFGERGGDVGVPGGGGWGGWTRKGAHTEDGVDDVISGFQIPFKVFGERDIELL